MLQEHPLLFGVLIAVVLIVVYFVDIWRWKLKSESELVEKTCSSDPKVIMVGLTQLRKRQLDISSYFHVVLPFLIADSSFDRVTAKMILQKHYPNDFALIKNYYGTDSLEECIANLVELNNKYEFHS